MSITMSCLGSRQKMKHKQACFPLNKKGTFVSNAKRGKSGPDKLSMCSALIFPIVTWLSNFLK